MSATDCSLHQFCVVDFGRERTHHVEIVEEIVRPNGCILDTDVAEIPCKTSQQPSPGDMTLDGNWENGEDGGEDIRVNIGHEKVDPRS